MNLHYYEAVSKFFDEASASYDTIEAGNFIMRIMRAQSLRFLTETFHSGQNVLEIGCGTGIETVELARLDIKVVATDISAKMISRTRQRVAADRVANRVEAVQLPAHDIDKLLTKYGTNHFDGAYSSFGALNCELGLRHFSSSLANLLKPRALFVCSIINRLCIFDFVLDTFLHKRINRLQSPVPTSHIRGRLPMKYYTSREFAKAFEPYFTVERLRALPAVLPPPHFEEHIKPFRHVLIHLSDLDWKLGRFFPFNRMADHFVVRFRKNS